MPRTGLRSNSTGTGVNSLLARAGIGAGAIAGLSIIPVIGLFAPVVGGSLAGWLSRDPDNSGAIAGATAGLFASLIAVPLFVAGSAVAATVSSLAAVVVLSIAVAVFAYVIGLGAVGGYLGARAASHSAGTERESVDRLRQRYVEGELTDFEFEQRLEQLLNRHEQSRNGLDQHAEHNDETTEYSRR